MHILYQADFRHNFFTLKTPYNYLCTYDLYGPVRKVSDLGR